MWRQVSAASVSLCIPDAGGDAASDVSVWPAEAAEMELMLHGHVHLRVLIVTVALIELWLGIVPVQLGETQRHVRGILGNLHVSLLSLYVSIKIYLLYIYIYTVCIIYTYISQD